MRDREVLIVTGGLGFIGKHFVRACLEQGRLVRNYDRRSYAADRKVGDEFRRFPNYSEFTIAVEEIEFLPTCDAIVHFAAESHVDNSISNSSDFCRTNFLGTHRLVELARLKQPGDRPLFVQISTDEVYGDIAAGSHDEDSRLFPSNPYAATKAAADMLVKSWGRTYGLPWMIMRPTNNYGPHQYPEKLIPKSAWRMKRGLPAIMHGDGSYVRSWLHVEDTCAAILTAIDRGAPNTIYNIAGPEELRNVEVLTAIAGVVGVDPADAWRAEVDRSGQDVRYSLDDRRLRALGWTPRRRFAEALPEIIETLDITRFA